ncbi:hypothetical protein BDV98DRAFT_598673 [Pterulicium gracile]|uniref:FAD-binding domain-containing protein n=1 Tax=Pterulicium gracile TaxID=1884261 RepID=A0A5C3PZS0_9AGAR|nr:hypothetical protein BDV98DRAFT_598673 [Pterula gracilis]
MFSPGPTGLFLAQALKHLGVKFSIFERDPSIAGRGHGADWGMGIYWSRPLLEKILPPDLFARICEATADPTLDPSDPENRVIPVHNGETGVWMHDIELDWLLRLSRKKVRALMSEGVDVQWGKFLEKIDMFVEGGKAVTVTFQDGTMETGTMIVGCDGGRSLVRQHAIQSDPEAAQPKSTNAGFVGVRSVFKLKTDEEALRARSVSPVAFMTIHPKGMWWFMIVLDVPDTSKPKDWTFQTLTTWASSEPVSSSGRTPDVTAPELQSRQAQFGGVFGDICRSARSLSEEDIAHNQIRVGCWPTKEWNSFGGRLVLCGDAAHLMPFMRGQGLNNAIADLAGFMDAMRKVVKDGSDLEEEVEKCNREIVKRGFKAVNDAMLNCEMVHDWEKFRESDVIAKGTMNV